MKPFAQQKPIKNTFEPCTECDFKITPLRERRWEIMPLSQRARAWSTANFNDGFSPDGMLYTDLSGVNSFLLRARSQGMRSEYNGPIGTTIL